MPRSLEPAQRSQALLLILVAALGNFVDVYDQRLFSLLRSTSLPDLGAGVTLMAEVMPKESRGIGTSLVAGVGVLGGASGWRGPSLNIERETGRDFRSAMERSKWWLTLIWAGS